MAIISHPSFRYFVHKPQFALAMLGLATTLSVTAVQYQTSLQPKTKPEGFEFEQKHSIRPGENRDTLFVDHSPNFLAHLQKKE
ncbi:hypothetical protein ABK040_008661 [Willaertia magna]